VFAGWMLRLYAASLYCFHLRLGRVSVLIKPIQKKKGLLLKAMENMISCFLVMSFVLSIHEVLACFINHLWIFYVFVDELLQFWFLFEISMFGRHIELDMFN